MKKSKLIISILSVAMTYIYFATDFVNTQNAFVVVLVYLMHAFLLFELYKNRKTYISYRKVAISLLCGWILAITSLIGVLTENNLEYLMYIFDGKIKAVLFLSLRTIFMSMLSLYLFNRLETCNNDGAREIISHSADKHVFRKCWLVMTLSWLPYCIMHFPARFGADRPKTRSDMIQMTWVYTS